MDIDLRVLELLSSKLCHDLISPVSAINNGVELIEDIGEPVVEEAMKLIGDSATLASKRLKLFRLAYGRAGSEATLGLQDVRPSVESYFDGGKIALAWPAEPLPPEMIEKQGCFKALINLLLLGEEILPYGGALAIYGPEAGDGPCLRVEIAGRGVQLSPPIESALEGRTTVDELTPRTVQAYVTGRFAAHFGLEIRSFSPLSERLDFKLLPAA